MSLLGAGVLLLMIRVTIKLANKLHVTFTKDLKTYQLDPNYRNVVKDVIIYVRQVKPPSSNPKSERYFWLNPDFIEGNLKHKKRRTNSCESILRLRDPNLW